MNNNRHAKLDHAMMPVTRLIKWLAACCMLYCVSAEKQVGTLLLYDTLVPRPPGITDPMAVNEYAAGGVAFGNAVWAYGALLMLDPKASTHVQWPESEKAKAWHQARRASSSHLYPSSDVLYAAMGPFILDSSNEPWVFQLAENLRGGASSSPSGTTPPLLALGLGVNNARFTGGAVEETGIDLPSTRACLRRAILNKACEKNYTRTVRTFKLGASSRSLLDALEARSPGGYGVRGSLTRDVLARNGYHRAQILGCPSLFINRHHGLGARLRRRYDALVDAHSKSSSANLRIAYNIFQDDVPTMDLAMLLLVQKHEGSFVIVQETTMVQQIKDRIWRVLGVKFPESKVRFFYRIEDWFEAVRSADIQVGSKIHGAMVSLAVETPLLLLPPSWRVQEMADTMALPALPICDWCQVTEWAANPTAKGLVTLAASTFQAEAFDKTRQHLACRNLDLFNAAGLPLHPEVASLCHSAIPHTMN